MISYKRQIERLQKYFQQSISNVSLMKCERKMLELICEKLCLDYRHLNFLDEFGLLGTVIPTNCKIMESQLIQAGKSLSNFLIPKILQEERTYLIRSWMKLELVYTVCTNKQSKDIEYYCNHCHLSALFLSSTNAKQMVSGCLFILTAVARYLFELIVLW